MEIKLGLKLIAEFPVGEPIVSMINYKDRILVATSKRLLEIRDGVVVPLLFEAEPDVFEGR